MSSKSNGKGNGNHRSRRTFKLNPATRAIRHALALTIAMATVQPALAGTCDVANPATATCNGDFIDTTIAYGIDDLTLVIGGQLPTLIDPLDGARGIDLSSSFGAISLTTSADLMVSNASAIFVRSMYGDIAIHNTSDASITGTGYYANATGIDAGTYYGDISIVDDGLVDVAVVGYGNATGIRASNFGGDVDIAISGTGTITASTDTVYGGRAFGVRANTVLGGASVDNAGDITADATGDYGNVTAYGIIARGGYYGTTSVTNSGDITSTAFSGDGVGWAWGVRARGNDVAVDNSGSITAEGDALEGYATAIGSYSRGYTASNVNTGHIGVDAAVVGSGAARAYGVMAWGNDATFDNSGTIDAHARIGYGDAVAFGALTYYSYDAIHTNSGDIHATAETQTGTSSAMALRNNAHDTAHVDNTADGELEARGITQEGYAFAYGVSVNSYSGAMTNAGDITATAIAYGPALGGTIDPFARANGIHVYTEYGTDSTVVNAEDGDVQASASVLAYGESLAFGAVAFAPDSARIENSGVLAATSYAVAGRAVAAGSVASGAFAVTLNYGALTADATVLDGVSQAVASYSSGEVATFVNEGDVSAAARADTGSTYATGAFLYANWSAAYNYGDMIVDADAQAGDASAIGIDAYTFNGSTVVNHGGISATAHAATGDAHASGVNNFAYMYGAYVTNEATLAVQATSGEGYAVASGVNNVAWMYGHADTTNAGDIIATATVGGYGVAQAMGVYSYAFVYGPQLVNGTGTITATATAGSGIAEATGVATVFYHGDAVVQNDGGIVASATVEGGQFGGAYAYGVVVDKEIGKYNFPNVSIVNRGDIVATAAHAGEYGFASADGIRSTVMHFSGVNDGRIVANATASGPHGKAEATGAANLGKYALGNINNGAIVATATAFGGDASATGLADTSVYADATTSNHGDIGASAISMFDGAYGGRARATGLASHANYVGTVDNTGTITAHADADHGDAGAVGVSQSGKYDVATLSNAGDIIVHAEADAGIAKATGTAIDSKYGAATFNDGVIDATAIADAGQAQAVGSFTQAPGMHGYFTDGVGGDLHNAGTIRAAARADGGQAIAIGSRVEGAIDAGVRTYNDGTISAIAQAAGGYAFATGAKTWSYYGDVALANHGDILAHADAGEAGHASATGGIVDAVGLGGSAYHAGAASFTNAGTVAASALATLDATAIGLQVNGESGANGTNAGTISASADGAAALGQAAGIVLASTAGDITLDNAGMIVATANGGADSTAFGVHMTSIGTNALANTGTIAANGTNMSSTAIWSSDDAIATIDNNGTVSGAIRTGTLGDTFANGAHGLWDAHGVSDFGDGDNIVDNGGMLQMTDATIAFGAGNDAFANTGTIVVAGNANRIDLGTANAFAFDHHGVMDFIDGAADDVLAIGGDFAGDGVLRMDVSGLHGASDLLYVEGNVVAGTVGTLDLNVLEMPTGVSSAITLVRVAGDSSADSFRLGNVTYDQGNFLALAFDMGLTATLDASNAQADLFQLGVTVNGLNDTGALAASIAPGAQRLMASQIGTWRQRSVDGSREGGVGTFARIFQDDGILAPALVSTNFGDAGHFGFDQKSSGTEVGIDFAVGDQLRFGGLLGQPVARQQLDAGFGSAKLDGDTVGVFGTWLSPTGVYVDASYRRMDFDTRLQSAGGAIEGSGAADAFNLEAGWAWTMGNGLVLEPQAQYTRTQVDGIDTMLGGTSAFRSEAGTSSIGRVGVLASTRFGTETTWAPYASVNVVREFDGENAYSVNDTFFGATSTEGTSTLAEAGVIVRFASNVSLTGAFHWQDGGALQSFFGAQVGMRVNW